MAENVQYEYGVLRDSKLEDAFHRSRLLNVEERPFGRVTGNLLKDDSLLRSLPTQSHLPSPPPDGKEVDLPEDNFAQRSERFREEILLDFQALENSLIRMQLIQSSNERERERYASEKAKILHTAQQVRDNTLELRAQLVEAQKVLELRKGYDKLADRILEDKKTKSRDQAQADIEALEKEIEDLEVESKEFEGVWADRKEQFERVVAEGEVMRKLIKGIKDDADEAMEEDEDRNGDATGDHDMDGDDGADLSKEDNSRVGTPRLDAATPSGIDTEGYPIASEGSNVDGEADGRASTPRPHNRFLEVGDATRTSSRFGSPKAPPTESSTDVEMAESVAAPETQVHTPATDDAVSGS